MSRISRLEDYAQRTHVSALNPEAPAADNAPGIDTEAGERAATNDEAPAAPADVVGDPPKRTRRKAVAA
jgi:hypothetical protein